MAKVKNTEPKVEKPAAQNVDVEKSVEKQPASTQDIKQKAANQIAEDEQTISGLEIRKAYMRGVNDTCAKFERRY